MLQASENHVNIRGYTLVKSDNNYYSYKNGDIELLAFEFKPGKDKFPNIIDIDACSVFNINDVFYVVFAKECKKRQKFCL